MFLAENVLCSHDEMNHSIWYVLYIHLAMIVKTAFRRKMFHESCIITEKNGLAVAEEASILQ